MAEEQEDDEIFVYMGGDQVVPDDVRRVRIDKSVKIIIERAFEHRQHLIDVEFHDGIKTIGNWAFHCCRSLRSVKLLGVRVIKLGAFASCSGLADVEDVEFGDKLETIEGRAFQHCTSLRSLTMPSVRNIGLLAFNNCEKLTDLEFGEELETIKRHAMCSCLSLRRITIPLKDDLIEDDVFYSCPNLATVNLVGGIHNATASLHLEEWRNEMKGEINRINQVLPDTVAQEKTPVIQQWMRSFIRQFDHYKNEHKALLKEATSLLELALWKAKIEKNEEDALGDVITKKAKIDVQSKRSESRITSEANSIIKNFKRSENRITSGANIVIKNVLPFLELK